MHVTRIFTRHAMWVAMVIVLTVFLAVARFTSLGAKAVPLTMKPLSTQSSTAGCGVSFVQASSSPFNAGTSPRSLVIADFNLDSKPDIATANSGSNNVTVLLGNGNGDFMSAVSSSLTPSTFPVAIAVGDFNLDGRYDLVVANAGSNNIAILLGTGLGTFTQAAGSPVNAGLGPTSVVVEDFNIDGKPDVAVANRFSNNVMVFLGNGMGGFAQGAIFPLLMGAHSPNALTTEDFNLDGKPDLAVVHIGGRSPTILLGDGYGSFTSLTAPPGFGGTEPTSIAVGDFNLDGNPDLIEGNLSLGRLLVLIGNGNGNFTRGETLVIGLGGNLSVVVSDFDLDGKPDIAAAYADSTSVTILLGDGNGGFIRPAGSLLRVEGNPLGLAAGDLNLDGKPDLAIANTFFNNVTIQVNTELLQNARRARQICAFALL